MIPAGPIIDELCIQLNDPRGTADEQWKTQAWAKLNEAYRDVCGAFEWSMLKRTATLSTSYLVPADCRSIIDVRDDDKNPYNFVNGNHRNSDFYRNWYFDNAIATPLAEGNTLSVSEYGTDLASDAEFPSTTCADEYIRIGSNTGVYKIDTWTSTSAMTLVDHFRGDGVDEAIFQVRPRGTQVLGFCDYVGDALTPTGVEVTYVRHPLPLYKDEDLIELPGDCQAVKLKALQKLLAMVGFNQAADRKDREYLSALSEMKATEPSAPMIRPTSMFRRGYESNTNIGYIRGLSLLNMG